MTAVDVEPRAAELREQLHHHGYRYSVLDDPEIGDVDYDALLDGRPHRAQPPAEGSTRPAGQPARAFTRPPWPPARAAG